MNTIKKISLWLFGSVLSLSLFGFATSFAFNTVLNSPDELKSSLASSGIYEIPLDSVVAQNIEAQTNQNRQALDDGNKIIGEAVNEAFPDETLKKSAEQMIDGTFAWLRGETAYPDFRLDFSEERSALINEIADGAVERVETLEPCSAAQLQAIDLNNIDAFALQCRPPLDLGLQKQLVVNDLQNNSEILEDPVLSGERLLEEFGRRDTAGIADSIPTGFQWASRLPLLFGFAAVICGISVILLSETKRKGFRKLAIVLLSTGLMLVVIQVIVAFLLSKANPSGLNDSPELEIAFINLIEDITWKLSKPILIIAGLYVGLSAALLLALHTRGKGKDATPSEPFHEPSGMQQPAQNAEQPPRQLDTSGIPAEAPPSGTKNHD